jgi:hypothetical protein
MLKYESSLETVIQIKAHQSSSYLDQMQYDETFLPDSFTADKGKLFFIKLSG